MQGTRNSEITRVGFIISGCTFATYTKVLCYSLGPHTSTGFEKLFALCTQEMVDEMCTEAGEAMEKIEQEELGSCRHSCRWSMDDKRSSFEELYFQYSKLFHR